MNEMCLYCERFINRNETWARIFTIEKNKWLCTNCETQFKRITGTVCQYCSRPHQREFCSDCKYWNKKYYGVFSGNRSIFEYNEFMKEYMNQYKFRGDYILVKYFATILQQMFQQYKEYLFVPIPLSKQRLYERGFNQAEAIIKEANFPVTSVLMRMDEEKQSKKNRLERIKMTQSFSVIENVKQKNILLTDDIYTTGATIHQAALQLKEAGAGEIRSITIARS